MRHKYDGFALARKAGQNYIAADMKRDRELARHIQQGINPMDEIVRGNRAGGSVWGVALIAIAVFVAVVLVVSMFGSTDIATVSSVK